MHIVEDENRKIIVNEGMSLMNLCGDADELNIFDTESLNQVIKFKWDSYGKSHHFLGCFMHFFYTLILIIYVKNAYIEVSEN